ncbi:bacillithiol system redox-active protein YtxJ [Virgibacillus doumboii]|uniref:bacillithiol system redox-active protein YtxJ n=1 Tax=Virgibacillus doumboii TaxID=2697503 RepID=UPI0013DF80FA|nr:bacillithiol system redox-active protein YtxJ [Virgibacillus doumboii]
MVELKELQATEELDKVWNESTEKPVLLFKHSTTCPISAGAFKEYNSFLDSAEDNLNGYMVKVIESRDASNEIADKTNIKHESPQIFLIKDKEVLWNTSHSKITVDSIKDALKQA